MRAFYRAQYPLRQAHLVAVEGGRGLEVLRTAVRLLRLARRSRRVSVRRDVLLENIEKWFDAQAAAWYILSAQISKDSLLFPGWDLLIIFHLKINQR